MYVLVNTFVHFDNGTADHGVGAVYGPFANFEEAHSAWIDLDFPQPEYVHIRKVWAR